MCGRKKREVAAELQRIKQMEQRNSTPSPIETSISISPPQRIAIGPKTIHGKAPVPVSPLTPPSTPPPPQTIHSPHQRSPTRTSTQEPPSSQPPSYESSVIPGLLQSQPQPPSTLPPHPQIPELPTSSMSRSTTLTSRPAHPAPYYAPPGGVPINGSNEKLASRGLYLSQAQSRDQMQSQSQRVYGPLTPSASSSSSEASASASASAPSSSSSDSLSSSIIHPDLERHEHDGNENENENIPWHVYASRAKGGKYYRKAVAYKIKNEIKQLKMEGKKAMVASKRGDGMVGSIGEGVISEDWWNVRNGRYGKKTIRWHRRRKGECLKDECWCMRGEVPW